VGGVDRDASRRARGHGHAQVREGTDLAVQLGARGEIGGRFRQPARRFQRGGGLEQTAVDDPVDTAGSQPTGDHHRSDDEQHAGVDDPAVIALRFEVVDGGLGRVTHVFAQQAIDQRDEAEDHQIRQPTTVVARRW